MKRTLRLAAYALTTLMAAVSAPSHAATDLLGSTVTGAVYCCSGTTDADRFTNVWTTTVNDDVEFPLGVFTSLVDGIYQIPLNVNISGNRLEAVFTEADFALDGLFNGYVFTFAGAPLIQSVTVNTDLSTFLPTDLTFTGNSIAVNGAGQYFTAGSRLVLDIAVAPIPEPEALALAGIGLVTLLGARRLRRSAA